MNTFVIGGKRYRVKSKVRFMTFITIILVMTTIISGFALGGGVAGTEKPEHKSVMVSAGDTLWEIADTNKPTSRSIRQYIADIRAINDIDPGNLYPGQVINVPVYE